MPGGSDVALGNELLDTLLYNAAVTYPTLSANASTTNTLSVAGVQVGDLVTMSLQSAPGHIFLEGAFVSANGTITISWTTDSTGVTGSTAPCLINIVRPSRPYTLLPSTLT